MSRDVHDNWLYAHTVDHERCRIVMHTVYPHVEPPEWTDVVFEGVTAHHFREQRCGGGPDPAVVIFDVEETDADAMLDAYADLLAGCRDRGWPVTRYEDRADLLAQLQAGGARCFEVHGVYGIEGFVFATSMVLRARDSRAEVSVPEPPPE